ncbi:MAG: hypothetical protein V3V33_02400 [Candidatus Lokiarchaeia archaeon]
MRKKKIIIFSVFLILSNIFISFLNFYPYNIDLSSNSSINEIENKNYIYPKLFKDSDLKLNEGNFTKIKIISISNPGGKLELDPYYSYASFIGSNLSISFYLYDLNNSNNRVLDEENQANIKITYKKRFGTRQNGTLNSFIRFDNNSKTFNGIIETSTLVEPGNYSVIINIDLLGYEINTRLFYITILEKFNLDISTYKSNQLIAGEKLVISIIVGNIDNSTFIPLQGVMINIKIYINNKSSIYNYYIPTNQYGQIINYFIIPLKTEDLSFDVVILEAYNYNSATLTDFDIKVIPYREFIMNFYFYFVLLILSIGVIIIISYILLNKKIRGKERILSEFMQSIEDISKLEQVFILLKKSSRALIKKSYISKQFNSNVLKEYRSFIFSSNNFINPQNSLKEISYNNKILLIIEGKYLIIGLILKNKISDIFKNKLNEFLDYTETLYKSEFSSSNIHSNSFEEIENIFENKLNISITSPHSIESGKFDTLLFTESYSINIYNIINDMVKEKKKNSFYLSDIFLKFSKQTSKGILEFLMGITELKDTRRITPIKNNN